MERLTDKLRGLCLSCELSIDDDCDHLDHKEFCANSKRYDRLAAIEDILGDNYDLDQLRELVEADRDGRIKIYPKPENNTCGACGHFLRIAGRRCGTCDVQSQYRDRYGRADDRRGTFTPSQSRKACKRFEHREE